MLWELELLHRISLNLQQLLTGTIRWAPQHPHRHPHLHHHPQRHPHSADSTVVLSSKLKPSKEHDIVSKVEKEEQIVEVPRIDFIFRSQPLTSEYFVKMVQIDDLQYQMARSHIRVKSISQKNQCLQSTYKWRKWPNQASKPCQEQEDQEQWNVVCLVFNPGGHLLSSRMSSLQEGGNWCKPNTRFASPLGPGLQKPIKRIFGSCKSFPIFSIYWILGIVQSLPYVI